ncbi:MAG: L,D-transpeptidase family protein [Alphaproteobacteria bacterium]
MKHAIVRGLTRAAPQGKLHLGAVHFPCALGRSGRGVKQREGDGVTPIGRWPVRQVFYRADRGARPHTALPVVPICPWFGWCDAPGDANYNRLVRLPYPTSCERLWREDGLYDIVAVLGYNDAPRVQGQGSAIFMHIAHSDYAPTEGCVALSRQHLLMVLERLEPGSDVVIC